MNIQHVMLSEYTMSVNNWTDA